MKNIGWLFLTLCLLLSGRDAFAEEPVAAPSPTASIAPEAEPSEPTPIIATAPVETPVVAPEPAPASAPVPAEPPVKNAENLEFVSGEITGMDEAAKSITVKLYGEAENSANDKILTVKLEETTDITDGEKDRDIKSLTNGTEVDVEYDPATNKATYIFVY